VAEHSSDYINLPFRNTKHTTSLRILILTATSLVLHHSLRGPNMVLSIRLDSPASPHSTCVVGDKVSGSVVLKSLQDEAVGSVQITFFGRAKTKIHRSNGQSTTTYKGRADFFRYTESLYNAKYTLRAGEYAWPFTFTFPNATLQNNPYTQWKATGGFNNQPGHPLPPTFSASHHGFSGNYESFIEYKLEATLSRPPESYVFFARGLNADVRLNYSPTRALENPDPELMRKFQTITHSSLLLLAENEERSLTFKEKTKSIFKSNDLPRSCFSIFADLPRVICSGQRIPVFIGIEHKLHQSTAPQMPIVKLRSLALRILATTSVRAPTRLSFSGDVTDTTTDKMPLENGSFLSVPLTEHMDLREYYANHVGKLLEPTFSTYNICRSYRLDLKLTVQCVDKDFTVQFPIQPVVVLPHTFVDGEPLIPRSSQKLELLAQEGESNGADGVSSAQGTVEEPLPRYTPHDPKNALESIDTKLGEEKGPSTKEISLVK
jgi:hypothetical protein